MEREAADKLSEVFPPCWRSKCHFGLSVLFSRIPIFDVLLYGMPGPGSCEGCGQASLEAKIPSRSGIYDITIVTAVVSRARQI